MLNAVIDAMNKYDRLPKYIVVIPDSDVITYGGVYDDEATNMIYTLLHYLVKNINRKVDDRFKAIYKKKPGAVKAGEPRIAWVKMLDRPPSIGGKVLKSRHNDILEELLFEEGHSHIVEIRSLNQDRFFDQCGKLLAEGRVQFFKELDHVLKEFDRNKIELMPRKPSSSLKEKDNTQERTKVVSPAPALSTTLKTTFYGFLPRREQFQIDNRPFNRLFNRPTPPQASTQAKLSPHASTSQSYYGRDHKNY